MPDLPAESASDSTLAFRADPYRFIRDRARAHDSDAFAARILLETATCITGAEAAELFYDRDRFRRSDALPGHIVKLLFGQGGVQGLDGEAHLHRKALFMALMGEERLAALDRIFARLLRDRAARWRAAGEVALHPELVELAAETAFAWAGIGDVDDLPARARQMRRMFENAGAVGPAYWLARRDRAKADRWATALIEDSRAGRRRPEDGSALAVIAGWRDPAGALLPPAVAAVELINVVRPIAAVGTWLVFAVHAMAVEGARPATEAEIGRFVLELRRLYPFFPALGARTTHAFEWKGWAFPKDRLVLLDIWGTNRDLRRWEAPETFRPERFLERTPTAYDMIPQGGSDPNLSHRCPGEWISERMIAEAVRLFTAELDWSVPEQDLALDYGRLPPRPRDGMRISLG